MRRPGSAGRSTASKTPLSLSRYRTPARSAYETTTSRAAVSPRIANATASRALPFTNGNAAVWSSNFPLPLLRISTGFGPKSSKIQIVIVIVIEPERLGYASRVGQIDELS